MDTIKLIAVAAHVITILAIGSYVLKFTVSKHKNFPLLCLQLFGPFAALLIVLYASDIAATLSQVIRVTTVQVHIGAIMFLLFQQLLPGAHRK